jgi:hypothetical protein
MKNLVIMALFTLLTLAAWSKNPPPASTQQALDTSKAHTSQTQPVPTSQMTELDYYKKLAEQSKSEADRAHSDIMTGYAVNAGILATVVVLILAVQFFNVRSELEKSENLVRSSVANINTALAATQSKVNTELAGLRSEFEELQRIMLERLSQETTNRTGQIDAVLSSVKSKYGSRITDLEVKNQLRMFDTRPFYRDSATPEQVEDISKNNDELEQLLTQAINKLDAGTTLESDELNAIGEKVISMGEITGSSHKVLMELIEKVLPASEESWRKLTLLEASVAVFGLDKGVGQKRYYKVYKSNPSYSQFEDIQSLFT